MSKLRRFFQKILPARFRSQISTEEKIVIEQGVESKHNSPSTDNSGPNEGQSAASEQSAVKEVKATHKHNPLFEIAHSTQKENRPYFNDDITKLEEFYTLHIRDIPALKALHHELEHRKTPRAQQLKTAVCKQLTQLERPKPKIEVELVEPETKSTTLTCKEKNSIEQQSVINTTVISPKPDYAAITDLLRKQLSPDDFQLLMGRAIQQLHYEQLGLRLKLSRRETRKREQSLIKSISHQYQDKLSPFIARLDQHLDDTDGDTTLEQASGATQLTSHTLKLLIHLTNPLLKQNCLVEQHRIVRLESSDSVQTTVAPQDIETNSTLTETDQDTCHTSKHQESTLSSKSLTDGCAKSNPPTETTAKPASQKYTPDYTVDQTNTNPEAEATLLSRSFADVSGLFQQTASHHSKIINNLNRLLGSGFSIAELLKLESSAFAAINGVGAAKVKILEQVQQEARELLNNPDALVSIDDGRTDTTWPAKERLDELLVNFSALEDAEQKLIKRLAKHWEIPLTEVNVSRVVYQWPTEFCSKRFGGITGQSVYDGLLKKLEETLNQQREEDSYKSMPGGLVSFGGEIDLPPESMSQRLSDDLTRFLKHSDERTTSIIKARLGIDKTEPATLEKLGQQLSVTRERVRQLQKKADSYLLASMSLHPANIWKNIRENLSHNIANLYPTLSSRFHNEKLFIQFLATICQVDKSALMDLIKPQVSPHILNDFFSKRLAPTPIDDVATVLAEHYAYSEAQSRNAAMMLKQQGAIEINEHGVSPRNLTKHLAIGQAALAFPKGAPFRELHQYANDHQLGRTKFQVERLDSGISSAVEEGFIFQSGHGHYTHTSFLRLDQATIDQALSTVKSALSNAKAQGVNTLNLRIDVFSTHTFKEDYFLLRHIVREHGIHQGIYFNGKSGADTISLDEEFSLKGQKSSILDYFASEGRPLEKRDITSIIRSQSENHASFYLNSLMEEGLIVRISPTLYDLPERAFANVPVAIIFERAERILKKANRIVEAGIITTDCNTRLQLSYSKAWYFSLLRHFAEKYSKKWYFSSSLISLAPIQQRNMISIIRTYTQYENDLDAWAEAVSGDLLIERHTLLNAIRNARHQ